VGMEKAITSAILVLVVGVFVTMVSIVRDVLPSLGQNDQASLRSWGGVGARFGAGGGMTGLSDMLGRSTLDCFRTAGSGGCWAFS
jgi:hypothetical protein